MNAHVQPILSPNENEMFAHLDFLFGGFLDGMQDGLVELAWTEATPNQHGRYELKHAKLYELDNLEALVTRAIEINSRARTNVYIGAALRKPGTALERRTTDDDFYGTPTFWADLDDKDANDQAKHRFAKAVPSMVVRTGEFPHRRHQLWWRLTEIITHPERVLR